MHDPFFPGSDKKPAAPVIGGHVSGQGAKRKLNLFDRLGTAFILGGILLIILYAPAHSFASFVYAFFLTFPLVLIVYVRTFPAVMTRYAMSPTTDPAQRRLNLRTWVISLILIMIGGFDFINVVFDHTPISSGQSYKVIAVSVSYSRHDSVSYDAIIDVPEPKLRPLLYAKVKFFQKLSRLYLGSQAADFFNHTPITDDIIFTENVTISAEEYARFKPNMTSIHLTVHPGFLGLKWYEDKHDLVVSALPVSPDAPKTVTPADLSKKELDGPVMHKALRKSF